MPNTSTKLDEMAGALWDLLDWHEQHGYDLAEGRAEAIGGDDLGALLRRAKAALDAYPGAFSDDAAVAAFAGLSLDTINEKGAPAEAEALEAGAGEGG